MSVFGGRICVRMTRNLTCPPAQWERIVGHACNPVIPNTPAARLAAFLRDDDRASELVRQWIEDEAIKCMDKGQTVSAALLTRICRRVSIERLIHDEAGVPVKLLRAGARYEALLAERRSGGADPDRRARERIWDEAIDRERDRQTEGVRSGRIRFPVYLPYHDGRNSRPGSDNTLGCGGLTEWEDLFRPRVRRFAPLPDMPEDTDIALASTRGVERFQVTAAWLAAHGVDRAMVAGLGADELEAMGVDPQSVLDVASGVSCTGLAGDVDLVLRDPDMSRAVASGMPEGATAPDALERVGMPRNIAAAALAVERWSDANDVTDPAAMAREWARRGSPGDYRSYLRLVSDILERLRSRVPAAA